MKYSLLLRRVHRWRTSGLEHVFFLPSAPGRGDFDFLRALQAEAFDVEGLLARGAPSSPRLSPSRYCSGSDAHADQVGAVDALEAFRDHGLARRAAHVPLAAQSRDEPEPYSLPDEMIKRRLLVLILHRRVVDRQLRRRSGCARCTPPSVPGSSSSSSGCSRTCRAPSLRDCRGARRRS